MKWARKSDELKVGEEFTPLIKKMTQEKINKYVSAAEDYNPIHVDPEFARSTPFKSTIAPGFQYIAYISELMAREFGRGWYEGGSLDVRLRKVVKPGDMLTTKARIIEKRDQFQKKIVICDVRIVNQKGEEVVTGTTTAICE